MIMPQRNYECFLWGILFSKFCLQKKNRISLSLIMNHLSEEWASGKRRQCGEIVASGRTLGSRTRQDTPLLIPQTSPLKEEKDLPPAFVHAASLGHIHDSGFTYCPWLLGRSNDKVLTMKMGRRAQPNGLWSLLLAENVRSPLRYMHELGVSCFHQSPPQSSSTTWGTRLLPWTYRVPNCACVSTRKRCWDGISNECIRKGSLRENRKGA